MSIYPQLRSPQQVSWLTIMFLFIFAAQAMAAEKPIIHRVVMDQLLSGPADASFQAKCDSAIVMGPWGSGAAFNGQFEAALGATQTPDWNGWTSLDNTGVVGDFANIRFGLIGWADHCNTNNSCQVNFVDDGLVVPGTGGSWCQTWCYGPDGFVLNSTGGLAGDSYYLDNSVLSPVMPWPELCATGALLEFDVYLHETMWENSPMMLTSWHVRSTTSTNPADIESAAWQSSDGYYAGEGYRRLARDVSGLLEPGATFIQVRLSVREFSAWYGNDASPAPYFDNVRVTAFDYGGPSIIVSERELANDGFPAGGILDSANPGNNSVRFDMAQNVAVNEQSPVDPGDSLVIFAKARREGAHLTDFPSLHYRVQPNHLFDAYRTTGLPLAGTVYGSEVIDDGVPIADRFYFDLPDIGFFFPGDVMHYYFTATDDVSGSDFQTRIMPADTTGFSKFEDALSYDPSFTFRALPSVSYLGEENFNTPHLLLWDDTGDDSRRPHWHMALINALGLVGDGYDVYYTNEPSSRLDNGLGRRATVAQLAAYDVIFYAGGSQTQTTLGRSLAVSDEYPNLTVLDAWLKLGDKKLFLAGDNIVSDLVSPGAQGQNFVNEWLGVSLEYADVRPLISGQSTPLVQPIADNQVLYQPEAWLAHGGCPAVSSFDAVVATNGGQRLAEFLAPDGSAGLYSYSAATLQVVPAYDAKVISFPFDLSFIWDDNVGQKGSASLSARAMLVRQILDYFGLIYWPPLSAPDATIFSAHNYPNPFNPQTRIEFNLPRDSHVKLRIFNIRGQQVRTMLDEVQPKGPGFVTWDGTDGDGAAVAAGVYFYEVRVDGEVKVGKMALVK